ncbi:hypothetical protein PanWU01x14_258190, partial [Parasponia andersonii]
KRQSESSSLSKTTYGVFRLFSAIMSSDRVGFGGGLIVRQWASIFNGWRESKTVRGDAMMAGHGCSCAGVSMEKGDKCRDLKIISPTIGTHVKF